MIFRHIGRFWGLFGKKPGKASFRVKREITVVIVRYGVFLAVFTAVMIPLAYGDTFRQTMEGGVDITITYPDSVISGAGFAITVLVENRGWEDKQDIRFGFKSNAALMPDQDSLVIDRIAEGGSFGETIGFNAFSEDENDYFLNIEYSQVLVQNNETPPEPFMADFAIPITIKDEPDVSIQTVAPESIFTDAEFPFEIEILSEDVDLYDVNVRIIAPRDIEFRGETLHTFSSVDRGEAVNIRAEIITPEEEVSTQHNLPFEVVVTYKDHQDDERTESKIVPLVLRPRTFMEVTTDGGIWIGSFFIAPYVSLGTIVGIPAGIILSVLIRRAQNRPKKRARRMG